MVWNKVCKQLISCLYYESICILLRLAISMLEVRSDLGIYLLSTYSIKCRVLVDMGKETINMVVP